MPTEPHNAPLAASAGLSSIDALTMAKPFDLGQVRLLAGPCRRAMDKNADYLLGLDPDRLLVPFLRSAGLEPRAEAYGGWERETIAGHSLGHYLSACALQFAATGDERFLVRANRIVEVLQTCQNARSDGYVGGVPEGDRVFAEIAAGEISSKGFDLNGIWVPWYNLHKLFAGLLDARALCGSEAALDVVSRLADWAIRITANLDADLWQKMLACEHGGMNESLANLYAVTDHAEYLELALKFHHKAVLDPLEVQADCLPGLHGNTQIPKVIGVARLYELTGRESLRTLCEHFWRSVVHDHTYAIGGNTSGEYFGPSGRLSGRMTMTTAETCNTYNMLKLTKLLFAWNPTVEYADYYETAMLNHILASQDPETGMFCYFVSLHPGHFKTYSVPFDAFWCCVGTGMENHSRYGEFAYFHDEDSLYVNLFLPSELNWAEKGIVVTQETSYPSDGVIRMTVRCDQPIALDLKIRCPGWATGKVVAKVGMQAYEGEPGKYLQIRRTWRDGDLVDVVVPQALRLVPTPDDPRRAAIAFGPVVLAGDLGTAGMDAPAPFSADQGAFFGVQTPPVPVLVCGDRPVEDWVRRMDGPGLAFTTAGVGRPNDVTLIPFYEAQRVRYNVYWDLFDERSWSEREVEYRAEEERVRALVAASVDHVALGEMQPEREHGFEGEKTYPEAQAGRKMRIAWHGGWMSFHLKTLAVEPVDLVVSYWGADGRNREFDVLVEGQIVGSQTFSVADHNRFFDVLYALPVDLTRGKESLEIRFQGREGKIVGPVCSCRIVRRA